MPSRKLLRRGSKKKVDPLIKDRLKTHDIILFGDQRAVSLDDAIGLYRACFPNGDNEAWTSKGFREILKLDGIGVALARDTGGERDLGVGLVIWRKVLDEVELLAIGSLPARRKMGIGATLMEFMNAECRSAGVRRIFLEVNEANQPALRLYKRLGYQRIGIREEYYKGAVVNRNAITMACELNPDSG